MKIELARPEFAYDIASVQVHTWRAAYSEILSESAFEFMTIEKRAIRWGEILLSPLGPTYVAIESDAVVGFISGGPNRDQLGERIGEIFALYVLPEFWGTEIGGALVDHAIFHAFGEYDQIVLWVLSENKRAIRFYEKRGFGRDGEEKMITFGDDTVPETRMRRAATKTP